MNYTSVINPKWSNPEHSTIDCEVDFDDLEEVYVPFTANPLDVSNPSSKEIFDRCAAEEFGPVAEFEPVAFLPEAAQVNPVDKLKMFLADNPDVAAFINS